MNKITLFDDSIIESEIGFDFVTGWDIPSNVKKVEFENGTILENSDFVEPEVLGG